MWPFKRKRAAEPQMAFKGQPLNIINGPRDVHDFNGMAEKLRRMKESYERNVAEGKGEHPAIVQMDKTIRALEAVLTAHEEHVR